MTTIGLVIKNNEVVVAGDVQFSMFAEMLGGYGAEIHQPQEIQPALQKALAEARKTASAQESLSALATCYGGLLVDLMGRSAAATFLQGHAVHIVKSEEGITIPAEWGGRNERVNALFFLAGTTAKPGRALRLAGELAGYLDDNKLEISSKLLIVPVEVSL